MNNVLLYRSLYSLSTVVDYKSTSLKNLKCQSKIVLLFNFCFNFDHRWLKDLKSQYSKNFRDFLSFFFLTIFRDFFNPGIMWSFENSLLRDFPVRLDF